VVAEYSGLLVLEYYSSWEFGDSYPQLYTLQSVNPTACTTFFFDPLHWGVSAQAFGQGIADYLGGLPQGALPVFCFGNHDQTRMVTRFGGEAQARMIAAMQLTLPGMPCIYNGEEIGMKDGQVPPEKARDGFGSGGAMGGRDPERTPMQWNNQVNAGFSSAEPWLPVADDFVSHNVTAEEQDHTSFLALYRTLLALRRSDATFRTGQFTLLGYINNVLAYQIGDYTVYANFNADPHNINIGDTVPVCSSLSVANLDGAGKQLRPYEALVVKATGENA
jgi:alpha-glucosidase